MKPITKTEVEKAYWSRPISKPHEYEKVQEFVEKKEAPNLTPVGWLLVGYEIARARAERGKDL